MPDIVAANLTLINPEGGSRLIRLEATPYIVGRSETAHFAMPGDTMLSRQHCAFEYAYNGWQVRDMGSKNGTAVNGQILVRERILQPGDRVVAGRLTFEFEATSAPAPAKRTGPLEFVDEAAAPLLPDSTFVIRLDGANFGATRIGTSTMSSPSSASSQMAQERTAKRIDALVKAGRELASFRQIDNLFEVTLDLALDSVGAKRGVLLTQENGELVARAHRGEGFRVSTAVRDKVMRERASMLVQDAASDSLLKASQTLVQQKIKSLMAVPLQTESQVIGILYVDSPNIIYPFDAEDLSLLTVFANIAAIRIEHARLLEIEHAEKIYAHDLGQAADIQRNLFPQCAPDIPGLQLAGRSLPCRTVGGDYFDYIQLPSGKVLVLVADVSGKGLAASLLMSGLQARVHAMAELETDIGKLVSRLNRSLKANTPDNKFITGFFAIIDPVTGEMEYSNAGHNPPILARRSGVVELLTKGGPVLAILPNVSYATGRAQLLPGDQLVMYSDGVSEANNAKGDEFTEEAVGEIAAGCLERNAEGTLNEIANQLKAFLGECSPNDDVTLLVARKL